MKNIQKIENELQKIRADNVEGHLRAFLGTQLVADDQELVNRLKVNDLHVLARICGTPNIQMSELVNQTTLTQGAVSKIIAKLVKLEIIAKYHKEDNKKDVFMIPTELGIRINDIHDQYHQALDSQMHQLFSNYSASQLQTIGEFLHDVNTLHGDE